MDLKHGQLAQYARKGLCNLLSVLALRVALVLVGCTLITTAAWLIAVPLGLVVAGLSCFAVEKAVNDGWVGRS